MGLLGFISRVLIMRHMDLQAGKGSVGNVGKAQQETVPPKAGLAFALRCTTANWPVRVRPSGRLNIGYRYVHKGPNRARFLTSALRTDVFAMRLQLALCTM